MNTSDPFPEPDETPLKTLPEESLPDADIASPIPDKPAWSPTAIAWFCVLFTMLPAGIMYALNYERLGQPDKKRRAFLFVIIAAVIYYTVLVYILVRMESDPWLNAYTPSLRVWTTLISIGFAWHFFLRQQNSFVQHVKQGGRKATLIAPLLLSCLGVGIFGITLTGIFDFQRAQHLKEFKRGIVLMDNGKNREAEAIFKDFKTKYPEDPRASWNLISIYLTTDRYPQARQEAHELLQHDPSNKDVKDFLQDIEDF